MALPAFYFPSYWDQLHTHLGPEVEALLTERDRALEDWMAEVRRIVG